MMIDAHDFPSIQLVHKGYATSHGQLPGSMWPFKLLAPKMGGGFVLTCTEHDQF